MVEFFKTGNYGLLQHYIVVILVMWAVMVLAVAGGACGREVDSARGEKIYSGGCGARFQN